MVIVLNFVPEHLVKECLALGPEFLFSFFVRSTVQFL